jgi:hypothetical protein
MARYRNDPLYIATLVHALQSKTVDELKKLTNLLSEDKE